VFVQQRELMQEWRHQHATPELYERVVNGLGLTKHQEDSLAKRGGGPLAPDDRGHEVPHHDDVRFLQCGDPEHDARPGDDPQQAAPGESFQKLRKLF